MIVAEESYASHPMLRFATGAALAVSISLGISDSPLLFNSPSSALLLGASLIALALILRCLAEGFEPGTPSSDRSASRRLIQDGAYAHCRHPVELSCWLALLGVCVVFNDRLALVVVGGVSLILLLVVTQREEKQLAQRHREIHAIYCREVPRFGWRLRGSLLTFRATPFHPGAMLQRCAGFAILLSVAIAVTVLPSSEKSNTITDSIDFDLVDQ